MSDVRSLSREIASKNVVPWRIITCWVTRPHRDSPGIRAIIGKKSRIDFLRSRRNDHNQNPKAKVKTIYRIPKGKFISNKKLRSLELRTTIPRSSPNARKKAPHQKAEGLFSSAMNPAVSGSIRPDFPL